MAAEAKKATRPHPQQTVKCPRCDSSETKFCYYNNYSTTQPRYFCKNCKRYWTDGGTLRNVPVGGGLRRNKRSKPRLNPAPSSPQPAIAIHQPFSDNLSQFKHSNIAGLAGLTDLNPEINFELPHTPNYLFFNPRSYEMDVKSAATTSNLSLYQSESSNSQHMATPLPLPGIKNDPTGAYFTACPWPQERGMPQSLHSGEYLPRVENSSANYTLNYVNVNDWHQVSEGLFGAGGDNNYALMHPPQLSQWTDFDANNRL